MKYFIFCFLSLYTFTLLEATNINWGLIIPEYKPQVDTTDNKSKEISETGSKDNESAADRKEGHGGGGHSGGHGRDHGGALSGESKESGADVGGVIDAATSVVGQLSGTLQNRNNERQLENNLDVRYYNDEDEFDVETSEDDGTDLDDTEEDDEDNDSEADRNESYGSGGHAGDHEGGHGGAVDTAFSVVGQLGDNLSNGNNERQLENNLDVRYYNDENEFDVETSEDDGTDVDDTEEDDEDNESAADRNESYGSGGHAGGHGRDHAGGTPSGGSKEPVADASGEVDTAFSVVGQLGDNLTNGNNERQLKNNLDGRYYNDEDELVVEKSEDNGDEVNGTEDDEDNYGATGRRGRHGGGGHAGGHGGDRGEGLGEGNGGGGGGSGGAPSKEKGGGGGPYRKVPKGTRYPYTRSQKGRQDGNKGSKGSDNGPKADVNGSDNVPKADVNGSDNVPKANVNGSDNGPKADVGAAVEPALSVVGQLSDLIKDRDDVRQLEDKDGTADRKGGYEGGGHAEGHEGGHGGAPAGESKGQRGGEQPQGGRPQTERQGENNGNKESNNGPKAEVGAAVESAFSVVGQLGGTVTNGDEEYQEDNYGAAGRKKIGHGGGGHTGGHRGGRGGAPSGGFKGQGGEGRPQRARQGENKGNNGPKADVDPAVDTAFLDVGQLGYSRINSNQERQLEDTQKFRNKNNQIPLNYASPIDRSEYFDIGGDFSRPISRIPLMIRPECSCRFNNPDSMQLPDDLFNTIYPLYQIDRE